MGFDTAYEAISEEHDSGHRWAFGTGFTDPLAGVETAVPAEVDGSELAEYCLMLGDDALIMSHRLQQWLARAPELEEDTALANIALDLLGQARLLLTRAGRADGSGRTEDDYAFGRTEREFRNVRLAEITDTDFAALIARLFVFSTWRLALLDRLRSSADPVLAAVAGQGLKEITYHRDYAAQWLIRLGDGTDYSRTRMIAGLAAGAIEHRVLGEEAVSRMHRLRPRLARNFDQLGDIEVGFAGSCRTYVVGLVGLAHVQRRPVHIGVDGHRCDSHLAASADHTYRNLSPVGNQDLLEHIGVAVPAQSAADAADERPL